MSWIAALPVAKFFIDFSHEKLKVVVAATHNDVRIRAYAFNFQWVFFHFRIARMMAEVALTAAYFARLSSGILIIG